MKQRLLVMNGQRIVQAQQEGGWKDQKVDKAGELKPGIYNIYLAQQADKSKQHEGAIVHADKSNIFQQIGKNYVVHSKDDFDIVPEIGSVKRISYDENGKAVVSTEANKLKRGRSR